MTRALLATATAIVAVALAPVPFVPAAGAQQPPAGAPPAAPAEPAPRLADGRPDLSGVWWTGGDVGGRGYGSSSGGRGRGRGRGGPQPVRFTDLYTPEMTARAGTLDDDDDPTLQCRPTALGTLNVSMFDVGAVGQIVSTPGFVIMLTETFHAYKVVPTDGRAHREDVPPSHRGDSVGRWEGDTFVVETKNFTDDTWIWAEGQVSPHSDQLRLVERYSRPDRNTLVIETTVHDPVVLTEPWTVPTQRLVLAPFDQLLPLNCVPLDDAVPAASP
jgi:hypothetical protein